MRYTLGISALSLPPLAKYLITKRICGNSVLSATVTAHEMHDSASITSRRQLGQLQFERRKD